MKSNYWVNIKKIEKLENNKPQNDDDLMIDNKIESDKNNIYFYSEVERENILDLNRKLKNIDLTISNHSNEWDYCNSVVPIKLHINSYGGSVIDGLCAVDHIRKCKNPVHTIVEGCAASAASLMSVVGTKRFIHKHSYILIHQLSAWHAGNFEQLKDEMENCRLLMKAIKEIYREYTKFTKKDLDKILKRDLFLDANECLRFGLVDEVIE
jgi:ATP-dependent Clp protease, protease subunit